MTIKKSQKGFTLIELLVVVAIISLLAVLGVGNLVTSQRRARNVKRIADLRSIANAQEQLFSTTTPPEYDTNLLDGIDPVMPDPPAPPPGGITYNMSNPSGANNIRAFCLTTSAALELPRQDANCTGVCDCTADSNTNCTFTAGATHYCITNAQ